MTPISATAAVNTSSGLVTAQAENRAHPSRNGGTCVYPIANGEPGGSGKYVSSQCLAFQARHHAFISLTPCGVQVGELELYPARRWTPLSIPAAVIRFHARSVRRMAQRSNVPA